MSYSFLPYQRALSKMIAFLSARSASGSAGFSVSRANLTFVLTQVFVLCQGDFGHKHNKVDVPNKDHISSANLVTVEFSWNTIFGLCLSFGKKSLLNFLQLIET